MKIVHVVAKLPPQIGGMENIVKALAERMALKDHMAMFSLQVTEEVKRLKRMGI